MITLSNKSIIKGFLQENALSMILSVVILTSAVFLDALYIHANPHMEGKWTTGCQVHTVTNSVHETVQITENLLTSEAIIYADPACKEPMTAVRSARTIKFLHTNVLETTVARTSYEILDSKYIPTLNAAKFFGISDWKLHTSYDIAGKKDNFWDIAAYPAIGTKETVRVVLTDSALAFTTMTSDKVDKTPLHKDTDAK